MEQLDLDIDHYSLQELLGLFHLEYDFNKSDLRKAYKRVLMTHPDKSGLDKKYFLFFSHAFKTIKQIYDATNKKEECVERKVYNPIVNEYVDTTNIDTQEFNKKFNTLFEKVKLYDEEYDTGYEKWLQSNEDMEHIETSKCYMNEEFEKLKNKKREKALVRQNDLNRLYCSSTNHSSLVREKPDDYSCDLFSKLKYEDVKKAHTETVVPVTEEDYNSRLQFNNIHELNKYRKQNETIPNETISKETIQKEKNQEYQVNIKRNYKLMKQMEEIEKSHSIWNANFKRLLNQ